VTNKRRFGGFPIVKDRKLRIYSGATAVVTGGASGIGRAFAEELTKRGCEVVIFDLQSDLAEEVVASLVRDGRKVSFIKGDVCSVTAAHRALEVTLQRTGRIDFMFNNAGIGLGAEVSDHAAEDWHGIIDVNLNGVVNGIQAAYPIMIEQGFGHIVNTSSVGALKPCPGATSYAATKAAVFELSRSLRIEAQEHGVRVSVLCPGVIRTPILFGGKFGKTPEGISKEQLSDMWETLRPMDPNAFARKALNGIAENKAIIIIPAWWKVFWYIDRLSPKLSLLINKKLYQKTKRELFEEILTKPR
jgi:NAD(P)-dependent dehydrogenase (short-subunit alcohol dehydrogenase family)